VLRLSYDCFEHRRKLDEKNLMLGVTCEACPGPGAKHVAAAEAAQDGRDARCGARHHFQHSPARPHRFRRLPRCLSRYLVDVKLSGAKGVATVKSQPYRLESTKCGEKGDGRLTCIACHDPHQQTEGGTVIVRCGMPERSRSIHRRQAYNQSPRGGVFR